MPKYLITGATGGLGRLVVDSLLQTEPAAQIAALVRDPAKAVDLQAQGVALRQGNYDDYTSLVQAFAGIEKLFFVSGNDVANRTPQHTNVVRAAQEAGVRHVVYTSFQRRTEDGSSAATFVAASHLATEKLLRESGLAYTILKNALYFEVLPLFMGPVLQTGTIYLPAGEGRAAFASRADLGAASAAVLRTPGHENQAYDLATNESYSFQEMARLLSELSGQEIRYVSPTAEEFNTQLAGAGVPAGAIQLTAGFSVAIAQGEFDCPSPDLERLLGYAPLSLHAFLKAAYKL